MKRTNKGKKVVSIDFTGVSAEGGGRLLPEGTYQFEVKDVEQKDSEASGEPYFAFTFEVAEGDFAGTKAWDNMSHQPQALWKLRSFMEAAGIETTDGPMEVDPDDFVGLVVTASVIHEEYRGRPKHRIDTYMKDAEESSEEAETTSNSKKKTAKKGADDDETEWKIKQKVSFMDGKKKITGVISKVDGDKIDVVVKGVSKEADGEYELAPTDLEAA